MQPISYRYCHFPPTIIQHSVWLYARFSLSFRDVEDLLAERGIVVSYETVRRWVAKFGPQIACRLRRYRPRSHSQWHLDEMFVSKTQRKPRKEDYIAEGIRCLDAIEDSPPSAAPPEAKTTKRK